MRQRARRRRAGNELAVAVEAQGRAIVSGRQVNPGVERDRHSLLGVFPTAAHFHPDARIVVDLVLVEREHKAATSGFFVGDDGLARAGLARALDPGGDRRVRERPPGGQRDGGLLAVEGGGAARVPGHAISGAGRARAGAVVRLAGDVLPGKRAALGGHVLKGQVQRLAGQRRFIKEGRAGQRGPPGHLQTAHPRRLGLRQRGYFFRQQRAVNDDNFIEEAGIEVGGRRTAGYRPRADEQVVVEVGVGGAGRRDDAYQDAVLIEAHCVIVAHHDRHMRPLARGQRAEGVIFDAVGCEQQLVPGQAKPKAVDAPRPGRGDEALDARHRGRVDPGGDGEARRPLVQRAMRDLQGVVAVEAGGAAILAGLRGGRTGRAGAVGVAGGAGIVIEARRASVFFQVQQERRVARGGRFADHALQRAGRGDGGDGQGERAGDVAAGRAGVHQDCRQSDVGLVADAVGGFQVDGVTARRLRLRDEIVKRPVDTRQGDGLRRPAEDRAGRIHQGHADAIRLHAAPGCVAGIGEDRIVNSPVQLHQPGILKRGMRQRRDNLFRRLRQRGDGRRAIYVQDQCGARVFAVAGPVGGAGHKGVLPLARRLEEGTPGGVAVRIHTSGRGRPGLALAEFHHQQFHLADAGVRVGRGDVHQHVLVRQIALRGVVGTQFRGGRGIVHEQHVGAAFLHQFSLVAEDVPRLEGIEGVGVQRGLVQPPGKSIRR